MKRFAAVLIGVSITGLAIPNINFNNSNNNNNNNYSNNKNTKISRMNQNQNQNQNVKKVLISGASGFIGNALTKTLTEGNDGNGNNNNNNTDTRYEIYKLVRKTPTSMYEIEWNPDKQFIDKESLESLQPDVVIHLAGENILGIWTEEKKRKILESRTKGTTTLCEALSSISNPPKVFISASGCTYYGSNIYEPVDEYSPKGSGFFSDVVEKWEQSCDPLRKHNQQILNQNNNDVNNSTISSNGEVEVASALGTPLVKPTRIVNLRIGLVMDKAGGLLGSMYYPFLFGLGGVIGSGKQYLPWISLRDAVGVIKFAIENEQVQGPINVVSINPATNYEFTKTLGSVLNRPTIFWIPETPLRYLLGKDMSEETVLCSQRVLPRKLLDYGFRFQDTNLTETLDRIVNDKN
ncbi:hypothetical protein ACTFIZ_009098 [Dictyostelium cf. discoideum]